MLVEKVKQKLNGGSPKKSKQSDIESINRKTSRGQGMKPDKKLDVTSKNKSKSQSRSSSPRKKAIANISVPCHAFMSHIFD